MLPRQHHSSPSEQLAVTLGLPGLRLVTTRLPVQSTRPTSALAGVCCLLCRLMLLHSSAGAGELLNSENIIKRFIFNVAFVEFHQVL